MGAAAMSWKVTTDPVDLPVTLADAKAYLRLETDDEDAIVTEVIRAATDYCEQEVDLALMDQTITFKLDTFPQGRTITLPRANLLSVTSVSYVDKSGDTQTFTDYTADSFSIPARIVNNTYTWPEVKDSANAVTIVYRAGYKEYATDLANPIPNAVRQAMLMLIAHFYDNRNAVVIGAGIASSEVALAVTALLQKHRKLGV